MFGDRIPWFACSATLDDKTLNDLKTGAGFGNDVAVIRTSIDRPGLAWRIGLIPKGSQAQASALRFLFDKGKRPAPEASPAPQEIPKTIVFFDSKKEAYTALDGCRNWLLQSEQHQYSKKQVKDSIKVFHRDIAKYDKEAILLEFQRPAKDSSIRVIFATEALGLGVNLPDVRRVVQYGVPNGNEPAIVLQQGGGAGRDGRDAETILLMDHWVKGERSEHSSKQIGRRENKESAVRRGSWIRGETW
jgi:superfamily II DNA helicase RecQ